MRYFLAIPADWFHGKLTAALRFCWLGKSFAPAAGICREMAEAARTFAQRGDDESAPPIALQVIEGLAFRRDLWRLLAGELMLFSAAELPQIETPLESWAAVLHQRLVEDRAAFPLIQQAIQGSRDAWLGNVYRPADAGFNDIADVARLAGWLASVDPSDWRDADLMEFSEADRGDELAFAREWFPALTELYRRAEASRWVIVCERM